ncbi:hypothetical protein [Xenorhabdus anantnagensis]|uniref:Uncharacterized protein n=1 Tax=Xenorhabdus anantnagensis TaxID=3025875 RepID=A0ABT5LXE7_9GAMM|nr:hypothetical protein [Xenorhabdus anantnagensis]MDC9598413.1 hypothetical protein [Xenorhabdus anantnagensis]
MKYFIGFIIILFSVTAFSKQEELDFKAWEEAGGWGIYNDKPDSHFNPLTVKKYKENYLPAFSYVINAFNKQNVSNDFCLMGYKFNKKNDHNEFERVVIYWKTNNRLINWEIPDGDYDELYRSIIFSKPFIDISDSVVPYKEAEGAQALWAKEGVIQLIEDCELHGQKITIKPSEVINF